MNKLLGLALLLLAVSALAQTPPPASPADAMEPGVNTSAPNDAMEPGVNTSAPDADSTKQNSRRKAGCP